MAGRGEQEPGGDTGQGGQERAGPGAGGGGLAVAVVTAPQDHGDLEGQEEDGGDGEEAERAAHAQRALGAAARAPKRKSGTRQQRGEEEPAQAPAAGEAHRQNGRVRDLARATSCRDDAKSDEE